MAKTYYKFAERSAESQINWAEVGRNVSEMLLEDAAQREEKKAAIDEASRQFGQVLANSPTGQFKAANEWVLDYANDATQAMLLQDKLLKQGALSLKDYTAQRQNLNDGTNQMFDLAKQYQDKYAEAMTRYNGDISQKTEAWIVSQVEGLSNFTNTKAYINPTNYQVSVGKMVPTIGADGKQVMMLDKDPNNYMTIHELSNFLNIKLDKYDYTKAIDEKVNSLGAYQVTQVKALKGIYRTYGVTQIIDPTQRAKFGIELTDEQKKNISSFEDWENATISAQMANPFNTLSILTDALGTDKYGNEYTPTFSKEEADSDYSKILLERDGSGTVRPKFNSLQEKAAQEFMRTMIRNSIDQESKTDTQAMPSVEYTPEYILNRGDANREKETNATYWNQLWWGNSQQKTTAAQALLGGAIAQAQGLMAIDAKSTPGYIKLKYADGAKNRTIKLSDFTPAEWAATGVELHGEQDRNRAMNAGGGFQGKTVNTQGASDIAKREGKSTTTPTKKTTPQENAINYLKKNLTTKIINQTESVSVPQINAIIQPLGFTGVESGGGLTHSSYITISSPDGKKTKQFSLYNDSNAENKAVVNDIISWIQGNMDAKTVYNADKSGAFGSGTIDTSKY